MARATRDFDGVARATRKKADSQAVWPGPHALKYRFCTRAVSGRFRDDFAIHKYSRCGLGNTHRQRGSNSVSRPTRVFDGAGRLTRNKAACQAVWPAPHALTPRVEICNIPAPQNVENPRYCHAFHYFWGSKNMGSLQQCQFWMAPAGEIREKKR